MEDNWNLSEERFYAGEYSDFWHSGYLYLEEEVKEFIRRIEKAIDIIYGINLENAIKSGVSEKLQKHILELIKGCGEETKNQIKNLAGFILIRT